MLPSIWLSPYSPRTAIWNVFVDRPVPRLVVIWITPCPARAPYSEAAAAPFTISTWSMSSAPMSASVAFADCATPSMTIRGPCVRPLESIDVGPRSMTEAACPGCPFGRTTDTPAAFPVRRLATLDDGTGMSCESSRSTTNGSLTRGVSPTTPVTMMSWSLSAVCSTAKSAVTTCPPATATS